MIISHKYRFIFIKTAKTAGTSIETYLSQYCGKNDVLTPFGREEDDHEVRNYSGYFNPLPEIFLTKGKRYKKALRDSWNKRKFWSHIPAYLVKCRISKEVWNDYFKFCVERNPYDKALSHYWFIRKRFALDISLDDYFAEGYSCLNYPRYTDYRTHEQIIVNRVIRYESLIPELYEIFSFLDIPFQGALGVCAKGNYREDRRPYYEVLDSDQKKMIQKIYKKEIDLFDYEF